MALLNDVTSISAGCFALYKFMKDDITPTPTATKLNACSHGFTCCCQTVPICCCIGLGYGLDMDSYCWPSNMSGTTVLLR